MNSIIPLAQSALNQDRVDFFYPTHGNLQSNGKHWAENIVDGWIASGKTSFAFPFLNYAVTTFHGRPLPAWMYLYFSLNSTTETVNMRYKVLFRVRVVEWSYERFSEADTYVEDFDCPEDARIWFRCDALEEVRGQGANYLSCQDFRHANPNKSLLNAIVNSIAPAVRIAPAVVVRRACYEPLG